MLNPQKRATGVAGGVLVFIAMTVLIIHGLRRYTLPEMIRISPQFDAASALENTRVLAKQYPERVTGTAAAAGAADYLRSRFRQLSCRVFADFFSMWLPVRAIPRSVPTPEALSSAA